jgi:hypothetical protein
MAGSKPSHIAYVVQDAPEGSESKGMWREVGALWPTRNGFSLQIHDQFSISGRIVITERREREPEQPDNSRAQRSSAPAPRGPR